MAKAPWEKEQAPTAETPAAPDVATVVDAVIPPAPPAPPAPPTAETAEPVAEKVESVLPELDPKRQAPLALINLVSQGVPMAEAKRRLGL